MSSPSAAASTSQTDAAALKEQKELFMKSLEQIPGLGKDRSQYLTEDKYNEIVLCVTEFPTLSSKEKKAKYSQGHAWIKKYKVLSVGNSRELILNPDFKGRKAGAGANEEGGEGASGALDQSVVISHAGRVFEDLLKIHVAGGHCKSKTLWARVQAKHGGSIPQEVALAFVKSCPTCAIQSTRKPSSAGHKPILTRGFGTKGQIDLIDMQSCPDGKSVFLLNYQDSGTKLMDARDLSTKRSVAIAFALLDIFTTIGAPAILGCDNGREFSTAAGSKSVQITDEVRISFRQALHCHRSHTRN